MNIEREFVDARQRIHNFINHMAKRIKAGKPFNVTRSTGQQLRRLRERQTKGASK